MLTLNKKPASYFSSKIGWFGNTKEFQPRTYKYGKPYESPLKQSGNYFIEWKRKFRGGGRGEGLLQNKKYNLLCFMINEGHESYLFWPPYSILCEVTGIPYL